MRRNTKRNQSQNSAGFHDIKKIERMQRLATNIYLSEERWEKLALLTLNTK